MECLTRSSLHVANFPTVDIFTYIYIFFLTILCRPNLVSSQNVNSMIKSNKNCYCISGTFWRQHLAQHKLAAFDVTLDSLMRLRQDSLIRSGSKQIQHPLALQLGLSIKWWFLIWFGKQTQVIHPQSEMVRRRSRWVKIWVALFNSLYLKVWYKSDKICTNFNFMHVAFTNLKEK